MLTDIAAYRIYSFLHRFKIEYLVVRDTPINSKSTPSFYHYLLCISHSTDSHMETYIPSNFRLLSSNSFIILNRYPSCFTKHFSYFSPKRLKIIFE